MILETDDLLHPHHDLPYWNESSWFSFMVPERQLSGFVYFYHRPNMNYSVGGVGVWDTTGQDIYTCRYHDWTNPVATPAGAEMFEFSLENGLTVHTEKLLERYRFQYSNHGCNLDLAWEAYMAPHETGLPTGSEEWGTRHFTQGGIMRGTVNIDGDRIEVDCFSHRDHSWGQRLYRENPRSTFPWGVASDRDSFHLLAVAPVPAFDDPIHGTEERVILGWQRRDGIESELASGVQRSERGPDGQPLRTVIEAIDERGRPLLAVGECRNLLRWTGYPFLMQWWSLTEWTINGHHGWGESIEFMPLHQYRRAQRTPITPATNPLQTSEKPCV